MAFRETGVLTWEVLMNYLRWVGLMPSLLIVGVLEGWLAPLPSEALNSVQPTLTIDNVSVALTRIPNVNNACPSPDTAYNSCWLIPNTVVHTPTTSSRRIGNWYVGNYSATNKARVLINDASAAGSRDSMKMTGITFTPVVTTGTKVTHAIITHTFNEGGGNISGDYLWALAQGGQFDPPTTENVVGNKLKLTGTGTASGANFPLGVLDTGNFTTSTIPNVIGYVTKSKAASVVKPGCNTGSGRCAPVIKYDYEITVVGNDQLQLSDSVFGVGGVCYKGLKLKLLKLIDHIFDQFDHLRDEEHPMGCTKFSEDLNTETQAAVAAIVAEGIASGGVAVETCEGACIVINKTVDPDLNVPGAATFGFTATGAGMVNFTLTAGDCDGPCGGDGDGTQTFSGLSPDVPGGPRTITETGFPFVFDEDDDHDKLWWTRSVTCESANNPAPGNTTGPTTWTTFAPTFATVNDNRHALGDNPPSGDLTLRQGYVTVTNLGAGDTLTCTFVNRLLNDDVPNNNPDPPDID
jgi:hypothetical protein